MESLFTCGLFPSFGVDFNGINLLVMQWRNVLWAKECLRLELNVSGAFFLFLLRMMCPVFRSTLTICLELLIFMPKLHNFSTTLCSFLRHCKEQSFQVDGVEPIYLEVVQCERCQRTL